MKKKTTKLNEKKKPGNSTGGLKGRIEKDIDDLVHSTNSETFSEESNLDPDDMVHQPHISRSEKPDPSGMEDPDDLVHNNGNEEDDER